VDRFVCALRAEVDKVEQHYLVVEQQLQTRIQLVQTARVSESAWVGVGHPHRAHPDDALPDLLQDVQRWDDYKLLNSTAVYKILKKCTPLSLCRFCFLSRFISVSIVIGCP
jgi:SPX domain protein involved in polyphosphate accumulation